MSDADSLERQIVSLRDLADDSTASFADFKARADEVTNAFRGARLGDRHQTLWDEYQQCWALFKKHQQQRTVESRSTHDRVQLKIIYACNTLDTATYPEEVRRGKEQLGEARDELANSPRMKGCDYKSIRGLMDNAYAKVGFATERVQGYQEGIARSAYGEALSAFEYKPTKEAWSIYKSAQATIKGCWLSKVYREAYHRDMQALYERFQFRRDAQQREWEEKQHRWRKQQEDKLDEFREKLRKCEAFEQGQIAAASRCRDQAYGARSSDFADRMNGFAAEHDERAADARASMRRIEEIIRDIESKLRS